MPLIALWKSAPATVAEFTIEQVVSSAGDGKLFDSSLCSQELREYLASADTKTLARYAESCLSQKFDKSGQVLQDIVNEFGRRLDYRVINGLYAGRKNSVGNDGLWHSPENHSIVVEVKTTDAYRIPLDVIAKYRSELLASNSIEGSSSILIVVGREDTGELEAQVRGSRHAWDIRLISVEALIKLVLIKENAEEAETGRKIRSVLVPIEYTRVDGLVDVVFAAASDAQDQSTEVLPLAAPISLVDASSASGVIDLSAIQNIRDAIISALSNRQGAALVKKSRAMYWSSDHSFRVACTISKKYENGKDYWYAFHPSWLEFLHGGDQSFFVLGCVGLGRAFAIPTSVIEALLPKLNATERPDGEKYWHIRLDLNSSLETTLHVPRSNPVNIEQYAILLP